MLTLTEETKPVLLVKYEFEFREKIWLKSFLQNFRTIKILLQERNNNFLFIYLSRSAVFSVEIFMEDTEQVLDEN